MARSAAIYPGELEPVPLARIARLSPLDGSPFQHFSGDCGRYGQCVGSALPMATFQREILTLHLFTFSFLSLF